MSNKDRILIQVQVERDLHEQLVRIANDNERSLSAQVRHMLKQAVKDRRRI